MSRKKLTLLDLMAIEAREKKTTYAKLQQEETLRLISKAGNRYERRK